MACPKDTGMLLRLTYFSETDVDGLNLDQMITAAAVANQRRNITGMMIADAGVFVQVLEGQRDAVTSLFTKIATDVRHRKVVIVEAVEIERRSYPDWGMVYVNDPSALDGAWALIGGDAVRKPWAMTATMLDAFLFGASQAVRKTHAI